MAGSEFSAGAGQKLSFAVPRRSRVGPGRSCVAWFPNHLELASRFQCPCVRFCRNLSVSFNKIGDVQVAQGNLPEALKSFRDGLAIAERLDPAVAARV